MKPEKVKYEVHHVLRECLHDGCRNTISHFAAPKDDDPRTVAVWCREHAYEAWTR